MNHNLFWSKKYFVVSELAQSWYRCWPLTFWAGTGLNNSFKDCQVMERGAQKSPFLVGRGLHGHEQC